MKPELEKTLNSLLEGQKILTIATVDEEGNPWISTVFYVLGKNRTLYFLSGKTTAHSLNIGKHAKVAVAIHDDKSYFGKVWGVQALGEIKEATLPEVIEMGIKYVQKFPEAKEEFLHPAELVDAAFSARIYKFVPESFKLRTPEVKELTGESTIVI